DETTLGRGMVASHAANEPNKREREIIRLRNDRREERQQQQHQRRIKMKRFWDLSFWLKLADFWSSRVLIAASPSETEYALRQYEESLAGAFDARHADAIVWGS